VERYAESISAFEGCYEELSKRLQEASVAFYNKVRELESAFTQKLEAVATSLNGEEEESRYVDPEERLSDEVLCRPKALNEGSGGFLRADVRLVGSPIDGSAAHHSSVGSSSLTACPVAMMLR